MPDSDVTIGELSRRITAMEGRINGQFAHVNQRLDTLQFVNRDVYTLQNEDHERRISALEDTKKWTIRTLVAAFILPVLVGVCVALIAVR